MRAALGSRGAQWIAAGIAISTLGFLSQSMLTAPRVYYAMARDGVFFETFPQALGALTRAGSRHHASGYGGDRHRMFRDLWSNLEL